MEELMIQDVERVASLLSELEFREPITVYVSVPGAGVVERPVDTTLTATISTTMRRAVLDVTGTQDPQATTVYFLGDEVDV